MFARGQDFTYDVFNKIGDAGCATAAGPSKKTSKVDTQALQHRGSGRAAAVPKSCCKEFFYLSKKQGLGKDLGNSRTRSKRSNFLLFLKLVW